MSDKYAANCFFGALDEMVTSWVLSEHDYQLSHAADVVVDIFLERAIVETCGRQQLTCRLFATLNDVFFNRCSATATA